MACENGRATPGFLIDFKTEYQEFYENYSRPMGRLILCMPSRHWRARGFETHAGKSSGGTTETKELGEKRQ